MANPFYRDQWNPVRHGYYPQGRDRLISTKPKVVNIPVHFFGSNEVTAKPAIAPFSAMETKQAAAVKIQKAVRGFLVRKNARVVRCVAAEVDDIERKMKEKEDVIRLDSKERLKVTEALMSLLLRLDSVRGVRDFRKKVINRVLGLQEAIDSISGEAREPCMSGDQAAASEESGCEGKSLEVETEISMADKSIDGTRNLSSVIIGNDSKLPDVDGDFSMSAVAAEPEGSIGEAVEQISLDREESAIRNRNVEAEMETISASDRKSNPSHNERNHDVEAIDPNSSAIDVSFSQEQVNREGSRVKAGSLETSTSLEESEAHIQQNSTGEFGNYRLAMDEEAEVSIENEPIDGKNGLGGVEGSNATILTEDETEEREGSRSHIAEEKLLNDVEPTDQNPTIEVEMAMIPATASEVNLCSAETNDGGDVIDPNSVAAQSYASLDHDVLEGGGGPLESRVGITDDASRSLGETSGEERREMREVMQRMAIENDRLKEMVAEMCARSAEQCRLVEGIVGRVEQLERAVHRMENRRKKRKSGAACSALSSAK